MATQIKVDPEFIKLCRSLRDSQKASKFGGQREQRRTSSLEQLFDSKLSKIEEELKAAEKPAENSQAAMFDLKKVN